MANISKLYMGSILLVDFTLYALRNDAVSPATLTAALSNYVTTESQATALGNYVTKGDLSAQLAGYVTTDNLTTTLSGYVTTSGLNQALVAYATQNWVLQQIAAQHHVEIIHVATLPATGLVDKIYLVPKDGEDGVCYQYIWIDGEWVRTGDTSVSLAGYAKESWVTQQLSAYVLTSTLSNYYTKAQTDSSINTAKFAAISEAGIAADGKVSTALQQAKDYANANCAPKPNSVITQAVYNAIVSKEEGKLYPIS